MPDEEVTTTEESGEAEGGEETATEEAPNYEALFKEAEDARSNLESRVTQAETAAQSRMEQLERIVASTRSAPKQDAPPPEDFKITREQFEEDPAPVIEKAIQQEVFKAREKDREQVGTVLKTLLQRNHAAELEKFQAREPEVFELIKNDLLSHFKSNPTEMYRDGGVDAAWNYWKGKKSDEVFEARKSRRTAAGDLSTNPNPPTGPAKTEPKAKEWESEETERIAAIYGIESQEAWESWQMVEPPEESEFLKGAVERV